MIGAIILDDLLIAKDRPQRDGHVERNMNRPADNARPDEERAGADRLAGRPDLDHEESLERPRALSAVVSDG